MKHIRRPTEKQAMNALKAHFAKKYGIFIYDDPYSGHGPVGFIISKKIKTVEELWKISDSTKAQKVG